MTRANDFEIAKVEDVAQLLFDFCQLQPGVTYKNVTFKKKRVSQNFMNNFNVDKNKSSDSTGNLTSKVKR